MENKERLLDIKKDLNRKRPIFRRREHYRRKKLQKSSWRAPKGQHNKMRERHTSKPKRVAVGYRGPVAVRNLTRQGKLAIIIKSVVELQKINSEKEIPVIARTLGMKKKYEIVKKAIENNITFLNLKNPKKFLTDVESNLKSRKERRIERAKKKAAKKAKPKKEEKKDKVAEAKKQVAAKQEEKPKAQPVKTDQKSATEYAKQIFEQSKPEPKTEKVPTALDLAKAKAKKEAKK